MKKQNELWPMVASDFWQIVDLCQQAAIETDRAILAPNHQKKSIDEQQGDDVEDLRIGMSAVYVG